MVQIGAARNIMSMIALFLLILPSVFASALPPTAPSLQTPASPRYNYGTPRDKLIRRQTTTSIAVTGALGGILLDGTPPVRKEIRELQQDTDAWTLYLLGLDAMQFTDQNDPLSWYQIAGIHGRPFSAWDNVEATPGNENSGYCQHVSSLFPTWHRPYLALFEQVLYSHVQDIAAMYPTDVRQRYLDAAVTFRMPYWDWALTPPSGESVFPQSLQDLNVLVDGPAGAQTIGNPLYSYDFHPLDLDDIPNFPYTSTVRYPTTSNASATSRNSEVAKALDFNHASIQQRVYNLLSTFTNYTTFSNEAWIVALAPANTDDLSTYDSIESLHDMIHGATGGGGHMTYIEYAAFDPVFMLHHAMVDRVLGLWQALNPEAWTEPQAAMFQTFTTDVGEVLGSESPLTPFHRNERGGFWTSDRVRNMETFGYGYAETMRAQNQTDEEYREQVTSWVNNLYGSSSQRRSSSSPSPSPTALRSRSDDATYREYITVLRIPKRALSTPITIHIYLGPAPGPGQAPTTQNLVGSHSVSSLSGPAKASDGTSDVVTATVPLTAKLRERGMGEAGLEEVRGYLAGNLRFRVVRADGMEVGNEEMVGRGLSVGVASAEVRGRRGEGEFPVWGEVEGLGEVDARL